MQTPDNNIDLDALFDTLNIGEGQSGKALNAAAISWPTVKMEEIHELSTLDSDLFLFDTPADQS